MEYTLKQATEDLRREGFDDTDIDIVLSFYPKRIDSRYSLTDMKIIVEILADM